MVSVDLPIWSMKAVIRLDRPNCNTIATQLTKPPVVIGTIYMVVCIGDSFGIVQSFSRLDSSESFEHIGSSSSTCFFDQCIHDIARFASNSLIFAQVQRSLQVQAFMRFSFCPGMGLVERC